MRGRKRKNVSLGKILNVEILPVKYYFWKQNINMGIMLQ